MRLPSLEPGLVWSPPETRCPNRLTASAWALLPLEAAWALVLPTLTIPLTSAATADESPGGAGVDGTEPPGTDAAVASAAPPTRPALSGAGARTTLAPPTRL